MMKMKVSLLVYGIERKHLGRVKKQGLKRKADCGWQISLRQDSTLSFDSNRIKLSYTLDSDRDDPS